MYIYIYIYIYIAKPACTVTFTNCVRTSPKPFTSHLSPAEVTTHKVNQELQWQHVRLATDAQPRCQEQIFVTPSGRWLSHLTHTQTEWRYACARWVNILIA